MIAGRSRRTTALWIALMGALVATVLLCPLPRLWSTAWMSKILDLGHVPLFACICLFLHSSTGWRWWICVLITSTVACLGEVGQSFVSRSANVDDAIRGVIGSLVAPVLAMGAKRPVHVGRILGAMCWMTLLLFWPLMEAKNVLLDAWQAYRAYPTLVDFKTPLQMIRFHTHDAEIDRVSPKKSAKGNAQARVTFVPSNNPYPTLDFYPPMNDWRGHKSLVIDLTVVEAPIELTITVFDWQRKQNSYENRFEQTWNLPTGRQLWKIDLEKIIHGPKTIPTDLRQIRWLQLYMTKPERPRVILLHRIYLE